MTKAQNRDHQGRKGLGGAIRELVSTVGLNSVLEADKVLKKKVEEYTLKQVEKVIEDLKEVIASEIRGFFSRISVSDELEKLMKKFEIQVELKVRFGEKKRRPSQSHSKRNGT